MFEKGVTKTGGGDGFADVWRKGFFAWEYKKKKRNLDDALGQLVRCAAALENPPLQVACDTDRMVIVRSVLGSAWRQTSLRSPGNANRTQSGLMRRSVTAPATRWCPAASASSARSSRNIARARPPADDPKVPTCFPAAVTAAPASGAKPS